MTTFDYCGRTATAHVVYLVQGGGNAMITQTIGDVVSEDADSIVVRSVFGRDVTIPREVLYLRVDGRKVTPDEMTAVFAEHGHKQTRA